LQKQVSLTLRTQVKFAKIALVGACCGAGEAATTRRAPK
jgi:hypothetical protein